VLRTLPLLLFLFLLLSLLVLLPLLSSLSISLCLSKEWVQCCDPSCGKWRALHRSMDAASLAAAGGEW